MRETLLFLGQLIKKPLQVSAMAPSSRFLARAMAKDLGPHSGRVVEFGPGTGRLTQGILNAGVAPENLTLFEMNPEFVTHLRARFPGVTVHLAGAETAPLTVAKGVGAVVSGVPLLSMPMALRRSIMAAAFEILGPDGIYVQFTYGPRPALEEAQVKSLGLVWKQTAYVALNLPPARVHTFRRA